MTARPHSVQIVVDSSFGNRLTDLPVDQAIWIVDSFHNRPLILRVWRERSASPGTPAITGFEPHGATSEEILLAQLDTIDFHHGELCEGPPWSVAAVHGARPTADLVLAFAGIGFKTIRPTSDGFVATRA